MSLAEEKRSGVNFYTGMFDFSDDGKNQLFMASNIKMKTYIEILFSAEFLPLQEL